MCELTSGTHFRIEFLTWSLKWKLDSCLVITQCVQWENFRLTFISWRNHCLMTFLHFYVGAKCWLQFTWLKFKSYKYAHKSEVNLLHSYPHISLCTEGPVEITNTVYFFDNPHIHTLTCKHAPPFLKGLVNPHSTTMDNWTPWASEFPCWKNMGTSSVDSHQLCQMQAQQWGWDRDRRRLGWTLTTS